MTLRFPYVSVSFSAAIVLLGISAKSGAQTGMQQVLSASIPQREASFANAELPDAPDATGTGSSFLVAAQNSQSNSATDPAQAPAPATPSAPVANSQTAAQSPPAATTPPSTITDSQKNQRDLAEEQLKQEKKQRIGLLPNFNASYIDNAVPLTAGQKFRLMFSTEKDPATIGFSMFVALIGQAEGSHPAYGGGIGGYGKRFGQNYADTFDGAFWGNAVLPSLWHQDPRYFRLGHGPALHRIWYALSTNVRAKHDGTGKWEPNYSNLVGNVISGGISNIYLPADERGIGSTFEGAFLVTAEGGVGSMLEEFWPDFTNYLKRRKYRKDHPADVDVITPSKAAPVPPATEPK